MPRLSSTTELPDANLTRADAPNRAEDWTPPKGAGTPPNPDHGAFLMAAYPTERRWIARAAVRSAGARPPPAPRAFWIAHGRPLALAAAAGAIALVSAAWRGAHARTGAPGPEAAMAQALAREGLACDADDIVWIEPPQRRFISFGSLVSFTAAGSFERQARAVVRAHTRDEPSDLYVVEARLTAEGGFVRLGSVHDITGTSGVDESRPLLRGQKLVYTTAADGLVTGVHVIDLAGPPPATYDGWTRLQKTQAAITNLQQTGQSAGFENAMFALDPVARRTTVAFRDDGLLEVHADDHVIALDPDSGRVVTGASFVRVVPDERARPGNLVTWAVDRVRDLPWFGDEKMQWLKAVAFTLFDTAHAAVARGTTSEEVRRELGLPSGTASGPATDPDVGWPPTPFTPVISPALPGEGQWIALDHDPFITDAASGGPAAFVTSFVRPDRERPDVRVYVTLWDPRQIALHMEAGTVEPISANGERGPGMIPRTPEVMRHVVAAFNGGFQAQHGEYGMVANGIEYLPPKPYAATVVELRDGSNGFGAWPNSGDVPDDVIALRQNLTALVQNGKFNPWGRGWWGGTPPGWPDQVHSTRSAICLTQGGFEGYFYSTSISAEDLARGMIAAGCSFGIHLDMNPGHAGFEFYDVAPEGELKPLARKLSPDWEAEGRVPDMAGYVFRSRRMIRAMGHMLFPRYIQREARDFFYLTSRSILPGPPIGAATGASAGDGSDVTGASEPGSAESDASEGVWRTKGLPQHGFPYALATTWVRGPDGVKLRVVRADPRTMVPSDRASSDRAASDPALPPQDSAPGPAPVVLAFSAPARGSRTLWWSHGLFSIGPSGQGAGPAPDAVPLVEGHPLGDARDPRRAHDGALHAAVGVQGEDGMLVWVEVAGGPSHDAELAAAMDQLLARLGCTERFGLAGDARAFLGGTLDSAGQPLTNVPLASARLVRTRAPDAHPVFENTPIVPIEVWQPLQMKRVRYFLKPAGTAPSPAISSSNGASRP